MGEHSGRYDTLANFLADNGFSVHSYDHQGHGRSPSVRNGQLWVERWESYVDDAAAFTDLVVQRYPPQTPRFLFGHSMGGGIAICLALRRPNFFQGQVFSGPSVLKGDDISDFVVALGRVMDRIWPTFGLKEIPIEHLTTIEAERQLARDDPLQFKGKVPCRCGMATLSMMEFIQAHIPTVQFPFLLLHGGADRICTPAGSQLFFERAATPPDQKRLIVYPGAMHEPHKDTCAATERNDILAWLLTRLPGASAAAAKL